jgi:hypothetical protein
MLVIATHTAATRIIMSHMVLIVIIGIIPLLFIFLTLISNGAPQCVKFSHALYNGEFLTSSSFFHLVRARYLLSNNCCALVIFGNSQKGIIYIGILFAKAYEILRRSCSYTFYHSRCVRKNLLTK